MLKPLGDRVLILPDQPPSETESGLYIQRNWSPEQTGTVVAVGETTCRRCGAVRPAEVKVGDWVIFSWQAGQEITLEHGEERYLLLRQDDLLAVQDATADVEGAAV